MKHPSVSIREIKCRERLTRCAGVRAVGKAIASNPGTQ